MVGKFGEEFNLGSLVVLMGVEEQFGRGCIPKTEFCTAVVKAIGQTWSFTQCIQLS